MATRIAGRPRSSAISAWARRACACPSRNPTTIRTAIPTAASNRRDERAPVDGLALHCLGGPFVAPLLGGPPNPPARSGGACPPWLAEHRVFRLPSLRD